MKTSTIWPVLVLGVLLGGCGTTRTESGRGIFPFIHDGHNYEIISTVASTGEGSNSLLLREGGKIVLRAWDNDQDGALDTLITGSVTLAQANEIYSAGLKEARSHGKYRTQVPPRLFEISEADGQYAVQTCLLAQENAYNKFILFGPTGQMLAVMVDTNADGILDRFEQGAGNLGRFQLAYRTILEKGMSRGRVEYVNDRYLVKGRNA